MKVIATAGHVDHGKSTLVRALTGMEPDRWAEERRRGLTIDLGYAWTSLEPAGDGAGAGETVAFVDVPGHERFVPNMLAGLGPVPAVLFVVAADEGWMPQSAEHLAAVDALGVTRGLLVVTRADLADPGPAEREALGRIAGTSLGEVESVAVSAVTGLGMEAARAALARLAASIPDAPARGPVRLWIDRSFTIKGSGTVVTGTLAAGTIAVGDELELTPEGRRVRVRGVQALGEPAASVSGVARVALNLRGVPSGVPRRGMALVTPGGWTLTREADVRITPRASFPDGACAAGVSAACASPPGLPPSRPEKLPPAPHLHIGSARVPVKLRLLGRPATAPEPGAMGQTDATAKLGAAGNIGVMEAIVTRGSDAAGKASAEGGIDVEGELDARRKSSVAGKFGDAGESGVYGASITKGADAAGKASVRGSIGAMGEPDAEGENGVAGNFGGGGKDDTEGSGAVEQSGAVGRPDAIGKLGAAGEASVMDASVIDAGVTGETDAVGKASAEENIGAKERLDSAGELSVAGKSGGAGERDAEGTGAGRQSGAARRAGAAGQAGAVRKVPGRAGADAPDSGGATTGGADPGGAGADGAGSGGPGERGEAAVYARLTLRDPLPLHAGDRVLLRDPGAAGLAIYGATVLDPLPAPLRRRGAAAAAARELASWPHRPQAADLLRRHGLLRAPDLTAAGIEDLPVPVAADWLADPGHWENLRRELATAVADFTARNPLAQGMPVDAARTALNLPSRDLIAALLTPPSAPPAPPVGPPASASRQAPISPTPSASPAAPASREAPAPPVSPGPSDSSKTSEFEKAPVSPDAPASLSAPASLNASASPDAPASLNASASQPGPSSPSLSSALPVGHLGNIVNEGGFLRMASAGLASEAGRAVSALPEEVGRAVAVLREELAADPFAAPDAERLRQLRLDGKALAAAARAGLLLRVAGQVVLAPGADTEAARRLAELPQPFTTSQARKALGTSRRVVIPLLEYLDRARLTERFPDDTRRVR